MEWSSPSRGGKVPHTLGTRCALARLNGRNTNKPDAWSKPVPPHLFDPWIDLAPNSNLPATQHHVGDVKETHEGWTLRQKSCLPLSQWLSPSAHSAMSDPTQSQSRRIRSLAAMCAGVT